MTNRRKRPLPLVFVLLILCCTMFAHIAVAAETTFALTIDKPTMIVDGTEKAIDALGSAPVIQNGRTLLPVRAVIEELGGTVSWDEQTSTATLRYQADEITLTADSLTAYLNGAEQTLDTPPVIINGRTMLPIRFIAESFHYQVDWASDTQTVTISPVSAQASAPAAKIGSDPNQATTVKDVPMLKLNNGMAIPQLGLGTFALNDEQAYTSVLAALQNGYRHIDTAHAYGNERIVGRAIKDSGVPREEIWVTSKIWPSEYGKN